MTFSTKCVFVPLLTFPPSPTRLVPTLPLQQPPVSLCYIVVLSSSFPQLLFLTSMTWFMHSLLSSTPQLHIQKHQKLGSTHEREHLIPAFFVSGLCHLTEYFLDSSIFLKMSLFFTFPSEFFLFALALMVKLSQRRMLERQASLLAADSCCWIILASGALPTE